MLTKNTLATKVLFVKDKLTLINLFIDKSTKSNRGCYVNKKYLSVEYLQFYISSLLMARNMCC